MTEFAEHFAQAFRRAGALLRAHLADGGRVPGPHFTATAAAMGLDHNLKPLPVKCQGWINLCSVADRTACAHECARVLRHRDGRTLRAPEPEDRRMTEQSRRFPDDPRPVRERRNSTFFDVAERLVIDVENAPAHHQGHNVYINNKPLWFRPYDGQPPAAAIAEVVEALCAVLRAHSGLSPTKFELPASGSEQESSE